MKFGRSTMRYACSLACALALTVCWPSHAMAQNAKAQVQAPSHHGPGQKPSGSDLIQAVREATERFRDVSVAEAEGYGLLFGCVSGPDSGAMGLHYVNMSFVGDTELDPAKPEIVIYEPQPDGRLKLVGADFLVFADAWNTAHPEGTPQLGGQLLHLFETPNRFGLPAFYTLHVWAWKDNPNGAFVNWHPKVSCENFNGQPQ
jgi:hypothetical protein